MAKYKKSEDVKKKILETTMAMIEEQGCNKITVRDICNKAEVSLCLLNYHFKSKDNLLFEIAQSLPSIITETLNKEYPDLRTSNQIVYDLCYTLLLVENLLKEGDFMNKYRELYAKPYIQDFIVSDLKLWISSYTEEHPTTYSPQYLALHSQAYAVAIVSLVKPGTFEIVRQDIEETKRIMTNMFLQFLNKSDERDRVTKAAFDIINRIDITMKGFKEYSVKIA